MKFRFYIIFFVALFYHQSGFAQYYNLSEDSLVVLLSDCKNQEEKVLILKELAFYNKNSNPVDALIYVEEALGLAKEIGFKKGESESLHTLGLIQFYLGDYDLALHNYFGALTIREVLKDKLGLGRSYNNIGLIYERMGEYDLAESYYKKGLFTFREIKDSIGIVYAYSNVGTILLTQKKEETAVNNLKIGLEIATAIKDKKAQAFTHGLLGAFYTKETNYKQAIFHYNKTLELRQELEDSYEIAKCYAAIGDINCQQGNFEESLLFLSTGLGIAESLGAKPLLKGIHLSFAKTYAQQGDFGKAYTHQQTYNLVRDSLINKDISTEMLSLEAKYEFEKKERLLLEQDNEIANLHKTYAAIAFLLFLVFVAVIYYRYRNQIKVNESLEIAQKEIIAKNRQLATYTKELEQFTYIASHDLKEPLRNISGFARILDRRYRNILDENGQQYLAFIMTGVTQMTDLLKDLLQYSEVKRLKKEDLKWVDLNDLIADIRGGLNGQLSKNNGQLIFEKLPLIYSNTFQMTQLFKNLITNGFKFQKNDKIPLVEVTSHQNHDFWEFEVRDNGIGIDECYHDKIFEMFKRLHNRKEFEGTGMGLAICKQIVEQHGGQIRVASKKGDGTSFIFRFPKDIIQI